MDGRIARSWFPLLMGAMVLAVALAPRSACAQGATTSLHGKWKVDYKLTFETVKSESGEEKAKEMSAFLSGVSFVLDFKPDGRLDMIVAVEDTPPETMTGKWKVKEERGMQLTLDVRMDAGGDPGDVQIKLLDKNSLRMVADEDKNVMIFRRVPAMDRQP